MIRTTIKRVYHPVTPPPFGKFNALPRSYTETETKSIFGIKIAETVTLQNQMP